MFTITAHYKTVCKYNRLRMVIFILLRFNLLSCAWGVYSRCEQFGNQFAPDERNLRLRLFLSGICSQRQELFFNKTMKFTLHLKQNHPFASNVPIIEINGDKILCNDIVLPTETHPHNIRLWFVGNEFGALGAIWASSEQDALDELIDAGLGDGLLIDAKDADEETTRLGNAGEPADLSNAWLAPVEWNYERDIILLLKFAEARGRNVETLNDI
jgi:hypothetical protein